MANFRWAERILALLECTVHQHTAAIAELRAAGVPETTVAKLYPFGAENYWRGLTGLLADPEAGPAALTCFAKTDVLKAALSYGLWTAEEYEALTWQLYTGVEAAAITYPGAIQAGWPLDQLRALYGLPVVLHEFVTRPAGWWQSMVTRSFQDGLTPLPDVRDAAEDFAEVLADYFGLSTAPGLP